jgi:alkanesulfonate monooxygenase SsuD/methylene tetrahydromethanopterin reductase-like flavin-dependent oxidoreductase (luciferase family)
LPYDDFAHSVGSLAEACTVIRRLWTETEPFDFDGRYVHLTGAFGNPKPIQRPHPPIIIGGRSAALLRVVAEHADLWNIPGHDIDDVIARSALLDRYCAEIGRDPASITRSIHLSVSYEAPGLTRDAIGEAIDAGFQHIVLGLPAPWPAHVARWVTDELITR